jgi:hypothetical protein
MVTFPALTGRGLDMERSVRIAEILERVRSKDVKDLDRDLVRQIAEIEERNLFDDDRTQAQKEIRQLLNITLEAEGVKEVEK